MKLSLILFSAAIFGVQQIIAAPAASASASLSVSNSFKAMPAATSSLAAPTMPPTVDGAITLDSQLVEELGWSQKDTDVLTGFLDAIERLGDLTGHLFDPATQQLLTDFQAEARELIANAGYKYLPATDGTNRRILSRISSKDAAEDAVYHPQGIPEIVEKLVQGLKSCLDKLKKRADSGSVFAQKMFTVINNLLTTLGKKIEEHLFPKNAKSGSDDSSSSKPALGLPTFLH